jgi:hypothetical protein
MVIFELLVSIRTDKLGCFAKVPRDGTDWRVWRYRSKINMTALPSFAIHQVILPLGSGSRGDIDDV